MRLVAAITILTLSAGHASASSFVAIGSAAPAKSSPSFIVLGLPATQDTSPSIVALGEPAQAVEMVNVASIRPDTDEPPKMPAWISEQIAMVAPAPPPQAKPHRRQSLPTVMRGGLSGEAFARPSPLRPSIDPIPVATRPTASPDAGAQDRGGDAPSPGGAPPPPPPLTPPPRLRAQE